MPKTMPWSEIRQKNSKPGVLKRAKERKDLRATLLAELRRAREMTQETLAETLDMTQGEVSRLERRTDLYVSTLRSFVEAMGGSLELIARFPDGEAELIELVSPELSR